MITKARQLDQFYTCADLAQVLTACLWENLSPSEKQFRFLEPSAGTGAFIEALQPYKKSNEILGLDLDPKAPGVAEQDFLEWVAPQEPWVVLGNPPFGKNSSLAVKFFNQAATFASVIAFIVPRTFEKNSLKKRLSLDFDLVKEVPIDPLSFWFEGERIPVPCVFQIWRKLPAGTQRVLESLPTTHSDFTFQPRPEGSSFAFQRVGAAAGKTKWLNEKSIAPPSHYFLVPQNGLSGEELKSRLDSLDWTDIKFRTAGNPSIGRAELVQKYSEKFTS